MIDLLAPEPHEACSRSAPAWATRRRSWRSWATGFGASRSSRSSPSLAEARLQQLGYSTVDIRVGDGSRGWAEHAPFDKILVTAAAERAAAGAARAAQAGRAHGHAAGRGEVQQLTVIDKDEAGNTHTREVMPKFENGVAVGNAKVTIALFKGKPSPGTIDHMSFHLPDLATLRRALRHLQGIGADIEDPGDEIGPEAPGSPHMGLWFHDPDGYRWELSVQGRDV